MAKHHDDTDVNPYAAPQFAAHDKPGARPPRRVFTRLGVLGLACAIGSWAAWGCIHWIMSNASGYDGIPAAIVLSFGAALPLCFAALVLCLIALRNAAPHIPGLGLVLAVSFLLLIAG